MSELNRKLAKLEHCIVHQSGARAAFNDLSAFLLDEYPQADAEPEPVKSEGGSTPLGGDAGGGADDGDTPTEDD